VSKELKAFMDLRSKLPVAPFLLQV